MGRHSMPGPEDSVDEPSDEAAADDLDPDDDGPARHWRGAGVTTSLRRHAATGSRIPQGLSPVRQRGRYRTTIPRERTLSG